MDEPAEHAAHAADAPFLQAVDVRQADVQALGQVLLLHVVQVHAFDDGLFLFGQPFQDVADLFQQQLAARGFDRVLALIAERILQRHAPFIRFVKGYGADGAFALQIVQDGPADAVDGKEREGHATAVIIAFAANPEPPERRDVEFGK